VESDRSHRGLFNSNLDMGHFFSTFSPFSTPPILGQSFFSLLVCISLFIAFCVRICHMSIKVVTYLPQPTSWQTQPIIPTHEPTQSIHPLTAKQTKASIFWLVFTARRYASAVLGVVILSVRLSVCPSVTRMLCD